MYKTQFDGNHMVLTIGQGYLYHIKSIAIRKYIISLFIIPYREQVTYNFEIWDLKLNSAIWGWQ